MSIKLNPPGTPMPLGSLNVFVVRFRALLDGSGAEVSTETEALVEAALAGNADAQMTLATTALDAVRARISQRQTSGKSSLVNAEFVLAAAELLYTVAIT